MSSNALVLSLCFFHQFEILVIILQSWLKFVDLKTNTVKSDLGDFWPGSESECDVSAAAG